MSTLLSKKTVECSANHFVLISSQELEVVGREFYNVLVVVTVDLLHFSAWANRVVPKGYSRIASGKAEVPHTPTETVKTKGPFKLSVSVNATMWLRFL